MTDISAHDLVLVTGMSGAGRSTALAVLEDLGFEAVDNLPMRFMPALPAMIRAGATKRLAVGIDVRTLDFDPALLQQHIDRLSEVEKLGVLMVFLDCRDEVLIRRFAETRRRHPLAGDRPVAEGLQVERRTIAPLVEKATLVIDTSDHTIWSFRERLTGLLALPEGPTGPTVTVMSFAFRHGVPREADLVFDVRFMNNPHYDPELRPLTGLDDAVGAAVAADPDFEGYLNDVLTLLHRTLPRHQKEGKSYLTIAIGCTGGRHRSVYTVETLAQRLAERDIPVYRLHRDLPKGDKEKQAP